MGATIWGLLRINGLLVIRAQDHAMIMAMAAAAMAAAMMATTAIDKMGVMELL